MIDRHESRVRDARTRGHEFGVAQRAAVENTVAGYQRLFREMHALSVDDLQRAGAAAGDLIASRRPELLEEIRGIAAGAEVDPDVLTAINARTEIFAGGGVPECSTLGLVLEDGPLLAQNWDWHPSADGSLVVWTVRDGAGGWFTTLTEAGILAKIGVNSAGLAVCINILATTEDGGALVGVPIHVVLRLILAECATAEEAERLVGSQRYSASTAISVADAYGDLRTFEVSPQGVGVTRGSASLCHTNHFLTDLGDAVDTIARDFPGTTARLHAVDRTATAPAVNEDAVIDVLRSHGGGDSLVCNHELHHPVWADRQQTMASVLIRPREGTMLITDGPPCSTEYVLYSS